MGQGPGGGGGGYGPPPGGGGYGPPPGGGYGAPGGPPPGGGYGGPPPGGGGYGGAPPGGGYGPPGGMVPPPGGGGAMQGLAAFTERAPINVILLGLVTCGIYSFVWKYQTTEELRNATGDTSINPGMDIILSLVTCGIWAIYTDYRNAKKVFELSQKYGLQRTDQSTIVILLMLFGLYIAVPLILQGEYNELAKAGRGGR